MGQGYDFEKAQGGGFVLNDIDRYLDCVARQGCPKCGAVPVEVIIEDVQERVLSYAVDCKKCGMKKKHVLLHGFEHSNDVFEALSILTEKEGIND